VKAEGTEKKREENLTMNGETGGVTNFGCPKQYKLGKGARYSYHTSSDPEKAE